MQDPNADTQWNDILRSKGIIPEITEDKVVELLEQTIQEKDEKKLENLTLDELNELEDDIDEDDEAAFEQYKRQRMSELAVQKSKATFSDVLEITKADYVAQVNNAGKGVWVVLHVYKTGLPLCALINKHLSQLAQTFPCTKFLRSQANLCIDNYPDKNLPTIFVYFEGNLKKKWIGPVSFGGMNLTMDMLEWMFGQTGAVETMLEECPKAKVRDVMSSINYKDDDDSDE